ncbi:MAG: DUF3016 domain-containing protein [Verrucomicrobiota bacterium]
MKLLFISTLALALAGQLSQANVSVQFSDIESFRDFTVSGSQSVAKSSFTSELKRSRLKSYLGSRKLELTFTDIDMAGDTKIARARTGNDIRVIKGVYPPRLSFNYVLRDSRGNRIKSGSASLKDTGFDLRMRTGSNLRSFHYELNMLERWARRILPKE